MTAMSSEIAIASSWSWVTSTVVTWTSSCSRRSHSRSCPGFARLDGTSGSPRPIRVITVGRCPSRDLCNSESSRQRSNVCRRPRRAMQIRAKPVPVRRGRNRRLRAASRGDREWLERDTARHRGVAWRLRAAVISGRGGPLPGAPSSRSGYAQANADALKSAAASPSAVASPTASHSAPPCLSCSARTFTLTSQTFAAIATGIWMTRSATLTLTSPC